jgi:four helix bundle protein
MRLNEFIAYKKAQELFGLVIDDLSSMARHPVISRLVTQQVAAADSICANIEEGYGRGSRKELANFLTISRGSAREVHGRYGRLAPWLPAGISESRQSLAEEIIRMLTPAILKLRRPPKSD